MPYGDDHTVVQWINGANALRHFSTYEGATQSQQHIKPLHWYVASRLVLEGGFRPEELKPRPPLRLERRRGENLLEVDSSFAKGSEATVFGGLKTKNVDVVVTKRGIGPVLAVSCKGMTGAFRNLTNRLEETIGECTNLHITYPALVFGYMFVIRAHDEQTAALPNDIAMDHGQPVESIRRFKAALEQLTGRQGIRDEISRYEAASLTLLEVGRDNLGQPLPGFPSPQSRLHAGGFFATLFRRYDERFVFGAPNLKATTGRLAWSEGSAVLKGDVARSLDYEIRVAGG